MTIKERKDLIVDLRHFLYLRGDWDLIVPIDKEFEELRYRNDKEEWKRVE